MAFIERRRPQFSESEAVEIAQSLYRMSGYFEELPSERDQNFYLRDGSGKEFVLKIASALELEETLEMQNKAMEHVASRTDFAFTQRICRNVQNKGMASVVDSSGRPHFVRMLTYLPGVPLALFRPHSAALLRNLGKALGHMDHALSGFHHAAARRDLRWDFDRAEWVLLHFGRNIKEGNRSKIIRNCLSHWREFVVPALPSLRKAVVYHDANEYNVLVFQEDSNAAPAIGLIDFGDMLFTYTVSEVAIGTAYAMLEKPDPLSAAVEVVRGYHSVFPLTETEIALLYYFISMRLCLSVSISAFQQQEEPANEYLRISEAPAWELLEKLSQIHPRLATYRFREACELEPYPRSREVQEWLEESSAGESPAPEPQGYGEVRFANSPGCRLLGNEGYEWRSIHLGLDYFADPGTPVYSPYDGVIHSFRNNAEAGDYGPTIIVEYRAGEIPFFLLYGHLSTDSLLGLYAGKSVVKGVCLGRVGTFEENGNWPPHLHLQIILDLLDEQGTFPGLCASGHKKTWFSLCPDPNLIYGVKQTEGQQRETAKILSRRKEHISSSLSISYRSPLQIIRGKGQFLFDENGRAYLDCVNNVCHVGHAQPRVVEAAQKQMSALNTNTRYLHKNLVEYAERLCATLPEPLKICFFVCSGSEANDLALRLARVYTGNQSTIVVEGAYHGNLSSLIEISPYKFDGPGGSGAPPFVRKVVMPDLYRGSFRYGDPEAGEKYAEDVRAMAQPGSTFIVESALGCGGQIILPAHYLEHAFQHVREKDGVCIVDEVQVGFGRVGSHFWCFETQNVVPDIVTMGKPIGNGHPLAAVVTTSKIAAAFENGMEYFNTFGGNPVSCAIGLSVLDVMEEENLQAHALETGGYLKAGLQSLTQKHALIGDVRGLGLFLGIEFVKDRTTLTPAPQEASYIVERMKERGILLSTDGAYHNVIKIKPPMVFTREDADWLVQNLDVVLGETPLK
ncbi:aminotransferase class III-fold pyridoxal phosphate-dependent enzyme [bacterium]|nr:aminotransferase class III-fold pyridoxal phosphate-dependent enzyme [bacterium]